MAIAVEDRDDPFALPEQTAARLTAQEQWVLARAASGWRTAAIADALGLSPDAVDGALASIIAKVGARSKIEAALIAVRDELSDVPTDPDQGVGRMSGYRPSAARPVMQLRRWRLDG